MIHSDILQMIVAKHSLERGGVLCKGQRLRVEKIANIRHGVERECLLGFYGEHNSKNRKGSNNFRWRFAPPKWQLFWLNSRMSSRRSLTRARPRQKQGHLRPRASESFFLSFFLFFFLSTLRDSRTCPAGKKRRVV